jgi:hypothetical protein
VGKQSELGHVGLLNLQGGEKEVGESQPVEVGGFEDLEGGLDPIQISLQNKLVYSVLILLHPCPGGTARANIHSLSNVTYLIFMTDNPYIFGRLSRFQIKLVMPFAVCPIWVPPC